ncbi:hypothetical protein EV175_003856 [Coemansia sp. RSA 1933]|nr:hypothetical protein EV175_003856 [Coemansia sp. RSA 1933]
MPQVAELAVARPRRGSAEQRHGIRRVAFFDVQPIRRADRIGAADAAADGAAAAVADNSTTASSTDVIATSTTDGGSGTASGANNGSSHGACSRAISLPSDVINAIADAAAAAIVSGDAASAAAGGGSRQGAAVALLSHQRLGIAPAMADDVQIVLRRMSQVCRAWRQTLLVRAWRSVHLSGAVSPHVDDIHAFASICAKRVVVPWGAMAAPVLWSASPCRPGSECGDAGIDAVADNDDDDDDAGTDCSTEYSVALSVDGAGHTHKPGSGLADPLTSTSAFRLRGVFGDRVWPAVEHLDMSFMPLICYQGFVDHIRRTMPRLRTLRITGFVPATALAEILDSVRLPLEALEIAGSVWANSDGGRRGSMSSWHSSTATVASIDSADSADADDPHTTQCALGASPILQNQSQHQPLALLAVTADALRSPTMFAFAMAQAPTLTALHLLECDHKIMDMLRTGRLEERHMRAVEWGATPMVLRSQEAAGLGPSRRRRRAPIATRWQLLRELNIVQFRMSPRENTGLRIHADCMPALRSIVVGAMEPSDHHLPAPSADDALQVPQLRGVFLHLARIAAPVLDLESLPARAPALRSLHISGRTGVSPPSSRTIDSLLSSNLPLSHFVVAGLRIR